MSGPPSTIRELLARALVGLGVTHVEVADGEVPEALLADVLPGLDATRVGEPEVAVALADAAGRLGRAPGVALLPGGRLHLGSQPGAAPDRVRVDDPRYLAGLVAGWSVGAVHAAVELELDLDLEAPCPAGIEPVALDDTGGDVLMLAPELASFDLVVLAGPGVVRDRQVAALQSFAAAAGCGVLNTWGAKGVFAWDSPHHLGTAGLQARDFALAGVPDAELVVAVGLDPLEAPADRWAGAQVLDVEPWQLATLAYRWPEPERSPAPTALYRELSAALAPLYASEAVPLSPARAARDLASARPDGGLVVADPGPAGLWVARTFPTTEPGSVVVPAAFCRGFAASAALVAGASGRPAVAVTTAPLDPLSEAVLAEAAVRRVPVVVEEWGADAPLASPGRRLDALHAARAGGGVHRLGVPVDFALTRVLVDVAGEVVAWTQGS